MAAPTAAEDVEHDLFFFAAEGDIPKAKIMLCTLLASQICSKMLVLVVQKETAWWAWSR